MRKIKVVIAPNQPIKFEAEGFQGSSCTDTIDSILSKMGSEKVDQELKPEYYENPPELEQYT